VALKVRSSFYFGYEVTASNNIIDFIEAASPLTNRQAVLKKGYYTATSFFSEVARAMTDAGTIVFTAGFDRASRISTITAPAGFTINRDTGPNSTSTIYTILGYDEGSDKVGSPVIGDFASGLAYFPQFTLLDYLATDKIQESIESSINETGSGRLEIVKFGLRNFMECNIVFITNQHMAADCPIETNPTGVEDAVTFLQEITKRGKIEFMEDRDDPNTFETLILESTTKNGKGLGFRLAEDLATGDGFFTTGKLMFRKVEG
jgi:hypothetical protein